MMALLVYSLRRNGGALAEAPVTITTNGAALPAAQREALRGLGVDTLRVLPRQPGSLYDDKFNALYAVEAPYDVLVYLDTDIVVLDALDGLVEGLDPATATVRARRVGPAGARAAGDYEAFVREFAAGGGTALAALQDDRFPHGYPLFNGGVAVWTRPAVKQVRADALELSHSLYARRTRESLRTAAAMAREVWRRLRRRVLPDWGGPPRYECWMTEQMGIALAMLANDVAYELLPPRFNWVHDHFPEAGTPPALYHYMKGRHAIDRARLFSGDWQAAYADADAPSRRALARLARDCAAVL
jgi:hypothetical protein